MIETNALPLSQATTCSEKVHGKDPINIVIPLKMW